MTYKHPPKSGQIKPGEVRNAGGRPKGSKNRKTIVRDIASKHHYVTIDGERCRVTVLEALLLRLQYLAIEKGGKALKEHQRLVETYDIATDDADKGHGVLIAPPKMTMEEYIDLYNAGDPMEPPKPFMEVLWKVHGSKDTEVSATDQN
ncbi:DUF5681 domain-containing protein [Kordiimonas aquimaris]|uniref:DUF5681 domain-containing protein n=1 Tax=Kordiimonas aquimaris TaxID=707591 RepID=UPI0021CF7BF3|nr:DUF5681 domain-containing protein [Kordiimonas aquimaris]